MLINRGLQETSISLTELMIVEAIASGHGTTWHFDSLCDMRNVLVLASAYKQDASAQAICDAMRIPMQSMRDRYAKTGRFGLSGPELQVVRAFVDYYRDFWVRQPVALYEQACEELGRFNASVSRPVQ